MTTSKLPFGNVRIIEKSNTLAGRLVGHLFADQGAEVFTAHATQLGQGVDEYLDRGKIVVPLTALQDLSSADVIIVDGTAPVHRESTQIVLRITAALPDDHVYGKLSEDCSEDLLNALVGFFTDMGVSSRILGRPVIYTPLPLCSVYAGVNGAISVAAALIDRSRNGYGRELISSRLAGGLSAIGALSLTSSGIPEHLQPTTIGGLPEGLSKDDFLQIVKEASTSADKQLWLEQRFAPFAAVYHTADNKMVLPLAEPNRRLTRRLLEHFNLLDKVFEAGMIDESCYTLTAKQTVGINLADSMALNFAMTSKLADMLEEVFKTKTAAEWENELNAVSIPCVVVRSWEEWKNDTHAHEAGIFAQVEGCNKPQIGRMAWVDSAQPYSPLKAAQCMDSLPPRTTQLEIPKQGSKTNLPLEGYTLVDFTNVVAGPNCARMFVELGAAVIRIEPMNPQHSPTIMLTWSGESAVGKKSIILDTNTAEGHKIMLDIVAKADLIVANKLDAQFVRLGLDFDSLKKINPHAVGIQVTAHRGEKVAARHNYPGYDPALQGATGIMERFGPKGCPTYHGVASCVDYLCGYLGAWSGLCALFAREQRTDKAGDWAGSSLAVAATLTQLLFQQTQEPVSARGAYATGRNENERVYKLQDGWIFVQGTKPMESELSGLSVQQALSLLNQQGVLSVPVQTCQELANRHRENPTTTVRFQLREKDGWKTECFAPTWFAFDGKAKDRPQAASRIGSDALQILQAVGYTAEDHKRLTENNVVGETEWANIKA
ncbi:MAG: Crotonobetainyl-CoA:carnitine CoA-transferase [Bacteroidota bacterium]|jgi:crotonobetainyl-CoA:carnitine CoA-transferase CaiB-like acyl-CoA transferase